jgi:hypothetical protein
VSACRKEIVTIAASILYLVVPREKITVLADGDLLARVFDNLVWSPMGSVMAKLLDYALDNGHFRAIFTKETFNTTSTLDHPGGIVLRGSKGTFFLLLILARSQGPGLFGRYI